MVIRTVVFTQLQVMSFRYAPVMNGPTLQEVALVAVNDNDESEWDTMEPRQLGRSPVAVLVFR